MLQQQQQQQHQGLGSAALHLSQASAIQKIPLLPVHDCSQGTACLQPPFQNCFPLRDAAPNQMESVAVASSPLSNSGGSSSSGRADQAPSVLGASSVIESSTSEQEENLSKESTAKGSFGLGKGEIGPKQAEAAGAFESKRLDAEGSSSEETKDSGDHPQKAEKKSDDAGCNYCDQNSAESVAAACDLDLSFGLNGDEIDLSTIMLLTELQTNQGQAQAASQVFLPPSALHWTQQQPAVQQQQQMHGGGDEHGGLWSHSLEQMIQIGAFQWPHPIVQDSARWQLPTITEQDLLRHQQIEQQFLMKQQQQQLEEQMQLLKQQVGGKFELRFDAQSPQSVQQAMSIQPPPPLPQQLHQQPLQQQLVQQQQLDIRPDAQRQNRVFVKGFWQNLPSHDSVSQLSNKSSVCESA